jgi:hypothetical protein
MKNSLNKILILIFMLPTLGVCQESPDIKWQVSKITQNHGITLIFSFNLSKDWVLYSINDDSIKPKISAQINLYPNNECFSLNGKPLAHHDITLFDKELDRTVILFVEKGEFSQTIIKKQSCIIDAEISYIISKPVLTIEGDGEIVYKFKDIIKVPID